VKYGEVIAGKRPYTLRLVHLLPLMQRDEMDLPGAAYVAAYLRQLNHI
jgi:hypothetical protein